VDGWAAGTDTATLRRLVTYWADGYDWRVHEARINELPSHFADLDGTPLHYLRFDGEVPDAPPLLMTNGWPSSFLELVRVAEQLASPSRFGGTAADAFTVIVPSLPGFPFSPQRPMLSAEVQTHDLWHRLMHDELGFARYAAHGGDLGAGVTSRLAEAHPEALTGSICSLSLRLLRSTRPSSPPRNATIWLRSPTGSAGRAATSTSRAPGR
jgi:pimeloyl-ACP methyl ester carboxylesterase